MTIEERTGEYTVEKDDDEYISMNNEINQHLSDTFLTPIGYFLCSPDQWNNYARRQSHTVMKRKIIQQSNNTNFHE